MEKPAKLFKSFAFFISYKLIYYKQLNMELKDNIGLHSLLQAR